MQKNLKKIHFFSENPEFPKNPTNSEPLHLSWSGLHRATGGEPPELLPLYTSARRSHWQQPRFTPKRNPIYATPCPTYILLTYSLNIFYTIPTNTIPLISIEYKKENKQNIRIEGIRNVWETYMFVVCLGWFVCCLVRVFFGSCVDGVAGVLAGACLLWVVGGGC